MRCCWPFWTFEVRMDLPIGVAIALAVILAVALVLHARRRSQIGAKPTPPPVSAPTPVNEPPPHQTAWGGLAASSGASLAQKIEEPAVLSLGELNRRRVAAILQRPLQPVPLENKPALAPVAPMPSPPDKLSSEVVTRWSAPLSKQRQTCGHTANCTNYGKTCCPMSTGGLGYDSCGWFSPRTTGYGTQVNAHFRRGQNGKYYWVKSHTRRT
jgi:hypothetical protein